MDTRKGRDLRANPRAAVTFADAPVIARPEGHTGIVLVPDAAEFWLGQATRLHHRLHYARVGAGWESCLLQP